MAKKEKLVLGLVVSLFIVSVVSIGVYKAEFSQTHEGNSDSHIKYEDKKADGSQEIHLKKNDRGSSTSFQTGEPAEPGTPIEATETSPSPEIKGIDIKAETSLMMNKGDEPTGGMDDSHLEKKLIDILNKNPDIIVGALQKFNQNQQRAQQEKLEASLTKYQGEISKESNAVVLGEKDAEIKLVVFLDPNCPHCRPFSQALNKVREGFPNVAIYVRHWAILGKDSEDIVKGLWAIKQQGQDKFNAATKAIASSEERYTFAKLLAWVGDHHLNIAKFKEDSESQATKDVMEETKKLATDIGLEGTPTSLLIDKKGIRLVMPTDEKSLESILIEATKT